MNAWTLGLAVVGWLAGMATVWRVRTLPAAEAGSVRRLSVIVPARDEANNLPRLLASLRAQTTAPLETIVVDDESSDATAAVAVAGGAIVVPSGGPPDGWTGKTWACSRGVRAARGDLLLLVDADVWFAPDAIDRLVSAHQRTADGLLSVQPFHVTERPYEQLSAYCNLVPVMASAFAALRAPRSSAVAFGPCMMTSHAALDVAGGYDSVRHDAIEDIALARRYRAAGRRVVCLAGADTVRFRMYPEGVRSLALGWTKNLSGGARRAAIVPTLAAVLWVCGAFAVAAAALASPGWPALALWAAFAAQSFWMLRRLGSFRWWASVCFPIPLVAFGGLFVSSLVARGVRRSVAWRGRTIPIGKS